MSFILDALKKSESDRQRQSGPALFEVKVAPPRTRLPLWAIAIAVLLVVNLGIVMWMLMRHSTRVAASNAAPGPVPAAQAAAAAAAVSAATPATAPAAAPGAVPPAAAPAPTITAATGAALALAASPTRSSAPGATQEGNPDDYAPAQDPGPAPLGGRVQRGTASGVTLYQDAATAAGTQIPQLRLDLHVFAARAQDRFVMINMHKVHEGDTLPEGVHVDSITPEGAVLSYNGSRFLLPRD
jgi:general secretion pathway protein B